MIAVPFDPETTTRRRQNRACSMRLLSRLVRYHGARPPDADAAAAVSNIRQVIAAKRREDDRTNRPRRRRAW